MDSSRNQFLNAISTQHTPIAKQTLPHVPFSFVPSMHIKRTSAVLSLTAARRYTKANTKKPAKRQVKRKNSSGVPFPINFCYCK